MQTWTYVSNAASPGARVIGPPGLYTFEAYATVNGTYARFGSGTVELGAPVDTPAGEDVVVIPTNGEGSPAPVTLVFDSVTTGGSTTASTTDLGPAAPDGHDLLPAIGGDTFLTVSTDATFEGDVEISLDYDADGLGLDATDEDRLSLQQYICEGTSCAWVDITTGHDTGSDSITGTTDVLNGTVLALTVSNVLVVPPTGTCVGSELESAQLETDPGECGVVVDNTNQLAGGCSGGGGGLASCTFDGEDALSLAPGEHVIEILGTAMDGSTATCESFVEVVDHEGPAITCPVAEVVECSGATTPFSTSATCEDNCGSCTPDCGEGSFALGDWTLACNAVDDSGNTSSCETTVTVEDTQAPGVSVSASPAVLWPPNHKMKAIAIVKSSTDVCDPAPAISCTATSNEPDNGLGDGDTTGDIVWQNGSLFLRAERSGTGSGRVYTITCTATDDAGNATSSSTTVTVPHSR